MDENLHIDVDPYGEGTLGEMGVPKPLEEFLGLDPDLDEIINKINKKKTELQKWFNDPWWKKPFTKPKWWI